MTLQIAEQELVTTADAQGRWRVTVEKPLADKQHSYTVTAVDVAGNTKTVAETVTIKTTLPDATAQLKDIQGFVTNQNKPTFMGTTDPYSTVNAVVGQKNTKLNQVKMVNGLFSLTSWQITSIHTES